MNKFDLDNVLKISELMGELEFERASALEGRLRWMMKENPSLKPLREHLRALVRAYEQAFWSDEQSITDSRIAASDRASAQISYENQFFWD